MNLQPSTYGLSSRVKLKHLGTNNIGIIKLVKSRIIQKDALKIIDIADKIRQGDGDVQITLVCYNNICSKSINLLAQYDIDVKFESE